MTETGYKEAIVAVRASRHKEKVMALVLGGWRVPQGDSSG
jgi:hypothetical protein